MTDSHRANPSRIALAHPWATVAVWCLVAIGGLIAFLGLRHGLFPDIEFPVVVVTWDIPAANAVDAEAAITIPAERALAGTPGLKRFRSTTGPSQVVLVAEFETRIPLEQAGPLVQARLASLPGTPVIRTIDINESPVATWVLVGKYRTDAQLMGTAMGTYLKALESVPGVLRVVPLGVDPDTLARLSGEAADSLLRRTIVRVNGEPGVALEVVKKSGANTLEVLRAADSAIQEAQRGDPDLHLVPAVTQGEFIRESSGATLEALGLAILLSILVIQPFLRNWRATAISALAIPASLLGAFIVMRLAGFGLETITLLALALVIGIIVDDAIVDVENILRHVERGEPPRRAALVATDEIWLAVSAATLTIVAVFLPVGLMRGEVGRFFKPFGLTISAAVLFSLLVARTLAPVLAAWWLRTPEKGEGRTGKGTGIRSMAPITQRYLTLLRWSLAHPGRVVLMTIAALALGAMLIPFIPRGFIPRFERHEFIVSLDGPAGATLAQSDAAARAAEAVIRADSMVTQVFAVAGTAAGDSTRVLLQVRLREGSVTDEVKARLRPLIVDAAAPYHASLQDLPLLAVIAEKPLQVGVVGDDRSALGAGARTLADSLSARHLVTDVVLQGAAGDQDLQRMDGRPAVLINGNLSEGTTIGAATHAVQLLARALPPGVELSLGGESRKAAEVFGTFAITLSIAALCVVAVLWFLFRSWQDPLAIGLSLPLAGVGAMMALFAARSDFGIVSLLGLVFLFGLASKNAILLVDRTNQLRSMGMSREPALLDAARERLRPIIMTTAATILGMLPIALGLGAGAELRAPLAVAIIGGLLSASVLSLLVVPVAYALLDRVEPRFVEAGKVIAAEAGVAHLPGSRHMEQPDGRQA